MITKSENKILSDIKKTDKLTAQLFVAFRTGDPLAFSHLYDLYIKALYNYGYILTPDKELVKDCIHDVFIKIYSKRKELNDVKNFRLYIFISLKNKIIDEARKRIYISSIAIEELNPIDTDDIEKNFLRIEQEQKEHRIIQHSMKQLSPRQQEAITLYYIENRKYKDICEIMNVNYQSVRNLIYSGLTKLRKITNSI